MLAYIGFSVSPDVYLLCRDNFRYDSCGNERCDACDAGGESVVQEFLATYNREEWGPRFQSAWA